MLEVLLTHPWAAGSRSPSSLPRTASHRPHPFLRLPLLFIPPPILRLPLLSIPPLLPQAAGDAIESPEALIRLWAHECLRVFHDRLVDDADREWLGRLVRDTMEKAFGVKAAKVLSHLITPSSSESGISGGGDDGGGAQSKEAIGISTLRLIVFGDFMNPGQEPKR